MSWSAFLDPTVNRELSYKMISLLLLPQPLLGAHFMQTVECWANCACVFTVPWVGLHTGSLKSHRATVGILRPQKSADTEYQRIGTSWSALQLHGMGQDSVPVLGAGPRTGTGQT